MVDSTDVFPPHSLGGANDNWARAHDARVVAAEKAIEGLQRAQGNANTATNGSLSSIASTIASMPIVEVKTATENAISATSSSFQSKCSLEFFVPFGRSRATMFLSANVALLDTVTGGIAAPPQAAVQVTWQTPSGADNTPYIPIAAGIPASKDSGASNVNNVISFSTSTYIPNTYSYARIHVDLLVKVFHSTAYATPSAQNYATLTALTLFTDPF